MNARVEHLAEGVTCILGDCREVMPTLGVVTTICTDPPYGIGADKRNAHSSIRDNDAWENLDWDKRPSGATIAMILSTAGEVAIWGGNYFANWLPPSSGWLAWIKPEASTGFSLADMELCWTNIPMAARVGRFPRRDGNDHPTQKPVSVMEWTLGFASGHTVCDPFMGAGSTGIAAVRLGRKFIGIEIEDRYFGIACRRISEALRQPDFFIEKPKPAKQEALL